jgi:hypothetical protein
MQNSIKFRPVHPFPARMAPSIALDELPAAGTTGLRVLDPMAGSGTTLVAARSRGHEAIGFDTDPLALLISTVWSARVSSETVAAHTQAVTEQASAIWNAIPASEAYPIDTDEETKAFVRYWFDLTNRRQLRALSDAITTVNHIPTRRVLWCAFSKLIIAKARGASWAMDLSHSRPHRVIDKPAFRPLPAFDKAVKTILENMPFTKANEFLPKITIKQGDARSLPLKPSSVDIVITSPPYLNAIDYMRCSKFSLVWMGYCTARLRGLRSTNIGTEVSAGGSPDDPLIKDVLHAAGSIEQLPMRDRKMLARYVSDMDSVIREISRVLVPKGRCVLVIGDCTMRGVFVRNSEVLKRIGDQRGLITCSRVSRKLPANRRYLPPPSARQAGKMLKGRMREEIVLTLQKG